MPRPRWFLSDDTALGMRAIIFDFHPGRPLSEVLGQPSADTYGDYATRLAETAARIHSADISQLSSAFSADRDWDESISSRITMLADHERRHSESDPVLRYLAAWLDNNRPAPVDLTLLQGDFQAPNILLGDDGEFSVIDWEFARVGDPREDLGRSKLAAFFHPPDLTEQSDDAFCRRYRELTGMSEAQLNPETLGYFAILGTVEAIGMILNQKQRFIDGPVRAVRSAYAASNLLPLLEHVWVGLARRPRSELIPSG
jgi:aminoglycoside phosphotransferase (APT) family kinase protein